MTSAASSPAAASYLPAGLPAPVPEPDGLELIQQFKSRFPGIKVVAISGGGHGTKVNYLYVANEIGAEAVLRKPFSTETLVRTLQELAAR